MHFFKTSHIAAAIVVLGLFTSAEAQEIWKADALKFTETRAVATLEGGWLKGEAARLAWSPDGKELYFSTIEGGFGKPDAKRYHYVISVADGKRRELQVEPEWAAEYWIAKSGQASPDDPAYKIELKSEQRSERTTSVPRGGDLARGGVTTATGTSNEDSIANAMNTQIVFMNSMLLHGQLVGYFENSVIVPGLTFGWGPKGSKVIAYAAKDGTLVVMDATGGRKDVPASSAAVLPAWSPDGSRLAWLKKDGRRKYVVQVTGVAK